MNKFELAGSARKKFEEYGLTYDDITDGDILTLVILLNREIKRANKLGETSVNMRLSDKHIIKHKTNGSIIECYLFVNGSYFTRRECISFNSDGFIGFAGWSGTTNIQPILRAFLEWCEVLKDAKEVADE